MKRSFLFLVLLVTGSLLWICSASGQVQNVVVYCDSDYIPYSYEKSGRANGIYANVLKIAFSRMQGYHVTIKPINWKKGLKRIEKGEIFALYPPYYRPKKRPYMDYTEPIIDEGFDIFSYADLAPTLGKNWPEDYKGKTIGINKGFNIPKMNEAKHLGVKFIESDSTTNILELASGRLDAYIHDKNAMLWQLKILRNSGKYDEDIHQELVLVANISREQGYLGFTNRDHGKFAFKKDFVQQFNSIIKQMKKDGVVQAVLDFYTK